MEGDLLTEELVRGVREGRPDAAALLFRRFQRTALAIAFGKTRDPEAAADVVQEAWLAALRKISSLEDAERFAPWFATIVANLARDRVRRRSVEEAARERLRTRTPAAGVERDERLLEAVERLDEEGRALVLLRFLGELSYAEIAETLGLPQNRVKWGLQDAFQRLRKEWKDEP